jgi:hypothetical protein
MYSYEDRGRAVQLYIKYVGAQRRELKSEVVYGGVEAGS